jgi:hypothetical protein
MRLGHADGALYWKAYAENKMGQRADALSTLVELQKSYPKSRCLERGWMFPGRPAIAIERAHGV